jgi:hypothetical protein
MSDDRPRAPTYGPPITIPSAYFLGLVAYNAWCEAHMDGHSVLLRLSASLALPVPYPYEDGSNRSVRCSWDPVWLARSPFRGVRSSGRQVR